MFFSLHLLHPRRRKVSPTHRGERSCFSITCSLLPVAIFHLPRVLMTVNHMPLSFHLSVFSLLVFFLSLSLPPPGFLCWGTDRVRELRERNLIPPLNKRWTSQGLFFSFFFPFSFSSVSKKTHPDAESPSSSEHSPVTHTHSQNNHWCDFYSAFVTCV